MTERFVVFDRYSALGIPRPDPSTVCRGPCEGVGLVPVYSAAGDPRANDPKALRPARDIDPAYREAWDAAEAKHPTDDGWHFLKCMVCGGTGRVAGAGSVWEPKT